MPSDGLTRPRGVMWYHDDVMTAKGDNTEASGIKSDMTTRRRREKDARLFGSGYCRRYSLRRKADTNDNADERGESLSSQGQQEISELHKEPDTPK